MSRPPQQITAPSPFVEACEITPAVLEELRLYYKDLCMRAFREPTPCDSPIEELFYYDYHKLKPELGIVHRQVECPTRIGNFRLDFMLESPSRRVGFECDGKEFHPDEDRDAARDHAIIRVILRVRTSHWFAGQNHPP